MAKLQDMFTQARRAGTGGGIGFLGKNKAEVKPRAAALVVEFAKVTAGGAEAALKAGADGLLFTWDGRDIDALDTLKSEIEAARATRDNVVIGLHITEKPDSLDQARLEQLKEYDIQYLILPFNAPARLLALETKDLEKVVVVPMRKGEIYPLYIHNLTAFDGIAGVLLDFDLSAKIGSMTIEEMLDYRAVREAVRFPAFLHVTSNLNEADAYTLTTLGIQALVLNASSDDEETRAQIKALRGLLETVHHDDKDSSSPTLPGGIRSK